MQSGVAKDFIECAVLLGGRSGVSILYSECEILEGRVGGLKEGGRFVDHVLTGVYAKDAASGADCLGYLEGQLAAA